MNYDRNKSHYIVVTGILVNKAGKYLIVKRADWEKEFSGKWTVPGGKMEVLDYALTKKDVEDVWYNVLENSLKREVNEEVGLEIEDIGYVTSLVYVRHDGIPCLVVSLYATPVEENVKLDNALTDFAWVSLEEAKNYDMIGGIWEELEMVDKKLKKGDVRLGGWKSTMEF